MKPQHLVHLSAIASAEEGIAALHELVWAAADHRGAKLEPEFVLWLVEELVRPRPHLGGKALVDDLWWNEQTKQIQRGPADSPGTKSLVYLQDLAECGTGQEMIRLLQSGGRITPAAAEFLSRPRSEHGGRSILAATGTVVDERTGLLERSTDALARLLADGSVVEVEVTDVDPTEPGPDPKVRPIRIALYEGEKSLEQAARLVRADLPEAD